jgi:hypothetical protein
MEDRDVEIQKLPQHRTPPGGLSPPSAIALLSLSLAGHRDEPDGKHAARDDPISRLRDLEKLLQSGPHGYHEPAADGELVNESGCGT